MKPNPTTYLAIATWILKQMESRHVLSMDRDNILGEGLLRIVKCAKKWDGKRAKFATYAFKSARRTMLTAARVERNYRAAQPKFASRLCRANRLKMFSELPRAVALGYSPQFARDDPTVPDADRREFFKKVINCVLANEKPRIRRLLSLRYGLDGGEGDLEISEVARRMGLSRERVRQLEVRVMINIRKRLERGDIREAANDMLLELGLNPMD